jgi:3-hydroxyacyl-CoA dehydrogenase/enoyl-CoA hydratase/3-hydroxybutyryl-CoA epimerase
MMRAAQLFRRRLKDPFARRAAGDRLIADPQGDGIAHADLVIEAISENLDAKHALLRAVEPRLKPSAILASNTSSLRIEDLATCLQSPERLVGIHFFNPVASMPLVEVIRGERSDPAKVVAAAAFVRGIDKLPLPLRSAPGFLVNAVLAPYMLAAMQEVDRGLAPETIDAAMRAFGMPMGPLELADTVGLDVVMAAGSSLTAQATPPACLQPLVSAGHLGRKSGKGFYDWSQKRPAPQARGTIPPDLADRLIAPLVARTGELVRDGVVEDADLADAGVIFGTGFAPFLGGPLHWQSGRHHPGIGDNTDVAAPPPKESR